MTIKNTVSSWVLMGIFLLCYFPVATHPETDDRNAWKSTLNAKYCGSRMLVLFGWGRRIPRAIMVSYYCDSNGAVMLEGYLDPPLDGFYGISV